MLICRGNIIFFVKKEESIVRKFYRNILLRSIPFILSGPFKITK